MAVFIDQRRNSRQFEIAPGSIHARAALRLAERSHPALRIGLINNMPDAAFRATERQFVSLLDAASDEIPIRLSLLTLPGIERLGACRHHAATNYSSTASLCDFEVDALIVTGREPIHTDLREEPYWESFIQLLEWARRNTLSTVWSCLAAHAAVLHMNSIARRKNPLKHFGVPLCTRAADHPLLAGLAQQFHIPHSRWNGLDESQLAACGYTILSRTATAGVDTFVKEEDSLFVFFQGHPEYETDTLLREFRRDVGRYLKNEAESYPKIPIGYFNSNTAQRLDNLGELVMNDRAPRIEDRIALELENVQIENKWRLPAARIYRNWLDWIYARKAQGRFEENVRVACSG